MSQEVVEVPFKGEERILIAWPVFGGCEIRHGVFRRYRTDEERKGWRQDDDCFIFIDGDYAERAYDTGMIARPKSRIPPPPPPHKLFQKG